MPRNIELITGPGETTHLRRAKVRLQRRGSGPWHYVGDGDGSISGRPDLIIATNNVVFLNGWTNGTRVKARFRYSLAGGTDVQASLSGTAYGLAAFILPPDFRPDADFLLPATDDNGVFLPLQIIASTGEVIPGLA